MALDGFLDQSVSRRARGAEMLDPVTEAALALAWRDDGDEAALHRLITAHLRLAVSIASRFRRYGAPMGDLVQEASIGLLKAADRFEPERGVRFSTYAMWWIKASVQDYVLRNWSMVRTGSTTAQKALFFNLSRVQAGVERKAEVAGEVLDGPELRRRIARILGVPQREVALMQGRMSGSDLSLNRAQGSQDDARDWIEALEDESTQAEAQVAADHDAAVLRGWLAEALGTLGGRERFIVIERRMREVPRTLEDIGDELGLSKERIRQLESAAFGKLRRHLEAQVDVREFL